MNGRAFFDTNVVIYATKRGDEPKAVTARRLMGEAAESRLGVLSYQVVQEFFNVALGKFRPPMTNAAAVDFLHSVVEQYEIVPWSRDLCERAFELRLRWKFSWYDCVIVAAALESGCSMIYTEDLQHGQRVDGLTVVNPFL